MTTLLRVRATTTFNEWRRGYEALVVDAPAIRAHIKARHLELIAVEGPGADPFEVDGLNDFPGEVIDEPGPEWIPIEDGDGEDGDDV